MMRRYALTMLAMILLSLSTACAATVTGSDSEPSESGPDIPESVGALTPEVSWAVPGNPSEVPSAEVGDEDVAGLSPKTTRGHVWAEPVLDGDTLSIYHTVAVLGDHVHVEVPGSSGSLEFIGYFLNDVLYLRAVACPNCGAERVEWGGSLVVCRACSTTFDLETGEATGGGRAYPSGSIPYTREGDVLSMSLMDLEEAYARTAAGEETLFELPAVEEDDDRGDTSWPRCCTI